MTIYFLIDPHPIDISMSKNFKNFKVSTMYSLFWKKYAKYATYYTPEREVHSIEKGLPGPCSQQTTFPPLGPRPLSVATGLGTLWIGNLIFRSLEDQEGEMLELYYSPVAHNTVRRYHRYIPTGCILAAAAGAKPNNNHTQQVALFR